MKLWVDDVRQAPEGWHHARTNSEAIRLLATREVEEISIDHDICHVTEKSGSGLITGTVECDDDYRAVAYYILAMDPDRKPKKVTIHTSNPWGAKEMNAILNGMVETLVVKQAAFAHDAFAMSPEQVTERQQNIRWKHVLEMQKRMAEKGA